MNNRKLPSTASNKALWIVGNGEAELREAQCDAACSESIVLRSLYSGISRGTERLVFTGAVPQCEYERMRAPMMEGSFPFPVKYGYATVGVVEDGPGDFIGKTLFALAPHQIRQRVPLALTAPVPDTVPAKRAVLTANMETALNAVWDSGAGPGDTVTVVGAGIVGLLIARLVARTPGADVTVIDIDETRAPIVQSLGASFRNPAEAVPTADVVFHTSATPAGIAVALASAAFEGRVVEVSWFGERTPPVPLGQAFHSQRLQIVSSQVGAIATSRRARWDYARRRGKAMDLLADGALDALLTEEVAFEDLPAALARLLAPGAAGLQTVVRY